MQAVTTRPASRAPERRDAAPEPRSSARRSPEWKFGGFQRQNRTDKPTEKIEPRTLHQTYFKSVGPRTYAAQLKEAGNGNHFLVLTEGKRDKKTNELKKCSLFVFSEDFDAFKDMLRDAFKYIAEHPVSAEVKSRQQKYWAKKKSNQPRMNADGRR